MEFKVGDIVRAIHNTKSISNSNIDVGSIWRVQGIDHSDGEEYDIRIIEFNNTTSLLKLRYGVWANSSDFEICKIKEKKDMSTEFKIGSIVECIKTHKVPKKIGNKEIILKGETFKIINMDRGDELDIMVSGINNDKRWWTNSKYFVILKVKEEKDMDKKVKLRVGDVIVNKCGSKMDYTLMVTDLDPDDPEYDIQVRRTNNNGVTFTFWASSSDYVRETLSDFGPKGLPSLIKIKDVIFNDPATIVFWEDGTKTIVKCQKGEKFDPEKGLAIAISKRCLGNSYCWHKRFMRWLPKDKNSKKGEDKNE